APFRVSAGPDPIPNLRSPLGQDRFARRKSLFETVQSSFVRQGHGELPADHDTIYNKAFNLMSSQLLDAFKIEYEDANTLDRYGDHQFGRNCLLARRLVEAGVPFI